MTIHDLTHKLTVVRQYVSQTEHLHRRMSDAMAQSADKDITWQVLLSKIKEVDDLIHEAKAITREAGCELERIGKDLAEHLVNHPNKETRYVE